MLINLLNSIIPGAEIVDLTYRNTEHHGMSEEDEKAIFDVYCEDKDGVRFLVFEDIPDDWTCPACGVGKEHFEKYK